MERWHHRTLAGTATTIARRVWTVTLTGQLCCDASAQFDALPDSDAAWIGVYDNFGVAGDQTLYYYLEPHGHDTLINDTTYRVLVGYTLSDPTPTFAGGLFENGSGQVYYYHPITQGSYLIYDFDVEVGDSVAVWIYEFNFPLEMPLEMMYIAAIDTLYINGLPRKAIGIQSLTAIQTGQGIVHWWVQGIGGTGGLLGTWGALPLDFSGGLVCMSASDTVWWNAGPAGFPGACFYTGIHEPNEARALRFSPNPANGLCTIDLPRALRATDDLVLSVYDNTGQLVQRLPLEFTDTGLKLDVREQAKGIYHVELGDGEQRYTGTIVFE